MSGHKNSPSSMAEFFPVSEAAYRRSVDRAASNLLWLIGAMLTAFLIWASLAEIDEVTRGEGRVIPSKQTQVIQNLEGGIVAEILVEEGDNVDIGQQLIRIDNTSAEAQYQKSRSDYFRLLSDIARLKAEIDEKEPVFPQELLDEAPDVASSGQVLYQLRQQELDEALAMMRHQVTQRHNEVLELESKIKGLQQTRALALEELNLNRPLVRSGALAKGTLLQLEKSFSSLDTTLTTTKLALPRAKAALEEANRRLAGHQLEFRAAAAKELSIQEAKLAALKELVQAEIDRVKRTDIVSPVRGIVKAILFNTIGGVVKPGETILEIVPIEEKLLVEAWITPQDIAFIRPDQPARVSITAYDPEIYGVLDAHVTGISADTFSNQSGASFFRIRLETVDRGLEKNGKQLPIIPGMTTSVDILTGKKTVLDYLINPINRMKRIAFSER